jgi:hypothetical protein
MRCKVTTILIKVDAVRCQQNQGGTAKTFTLAPVRVRVFLLPFSRRIVHGSAAGE